MERRDVLAATAILAALGSRTAVAANGRTLRLGVLSSADASRRQPMAYSVGRIAGGTRPADLPVEEFSSLRLIVNAKVRRALGIAMPRSLLLRADEVIS